MASLEGKIQNRARRWLAQATARTLNPPRSARLRRLVFVTALLLVALFAAWHAVSRARAPPTDYILVIDSGSSGTRLFAYTWRPGAAPGDPPLVAAVPPSAAAHRVPRRAVPGKRAYKRVETEPGLDGFVGDHKGLQNNALGPLLRWAMAVVPPRQWKRTPVFMCATAGLRKLTEDQQEELMHSARSALQRSPFRFEEAWARIITGEDEGMYGWVALNYLAGAFHPSTASAPSLDHSLSPLAEGAQQGADGGALRRAAAAGGTIGVLDLGGSSLEVAFELPQPSKQLSPDTVNVTVLGQSHLLYVHVHHHYGLNDAFDRSVTLLLSPTPPLHTPSFAGSGEGHDAAAEGDGGVAAVVASKEPTQPADDSAGTSGRGAMGDGSAVHASSNKGGKSSSSSRHGEGGGPEHALEPLSWQQAEGRDPRGGEPGDAGSGSIGGTAEGQASRRSAAEEEVVDGPAHPQDADGQGGTVQQADMAADMAAHGAQHGHRVQQQLEQQQGEDEEGSSTGAAGSGGESGGQGQQRRRSLFQLVSAAGGRELPLSASRPSSVGVAAQRAVGGSSSVESRAGRTVVAYGALAERLAAQEVAMQAQGGSRGSRLHGVRAGHELAAGGSWRRHLMGRAAEETLGKKSRHGGGAAKDPGSTDGPSGGSGPAASHADALPEVPHPCLHAGYAQAYPRFVYEGAIPDPPEVMLVGRPDHAACAQLAAQVVNASAPCGAESCWLGAPQPPATRGPFHALTGFYVVYRFFGLFSHDEMQRLDEVGREFCSQPWGRVAEERADEIQVDRYCFRASFVTALLSQGLQMPQERVQLGSPDIGWTLGVALAEGSSLGLGGGPHPLQPPFTFSRAMLPHLPLPSRVPRGAVVVGGAAVVVLVAGLVLARLLRGRDRGYPEAPVTGAPLQSVPEGVGLGLSGPGGVERAPSPPASPFFQRLFGTPSKKRAEPPTRDLPRGWVLQREPPLGGSFTRMATRTQASRRSASAVEDLNLQGYIYKEGYLAAL